MAPIKTSVIGAGMALQMLHWPSIACLPEMFSLHSVMDRSGRSSEKVKELCGAGVKIVRTLEEVVRDPEVELVVVASPNATHFGYVSTALNAGKHGPSSSTPPGLLFTAANQSQAPAGRSVLVEKPITRTAAEAQQLADLAKSKGLILTVYQNRRWDSDFLTVRKLIQDGTLGDVVEFTSSYDRYRPLVSRDPSRAATWKEQPEGGNETIYNLGSHIIDQAYVLFGRPEKVGCRVWDQRGTGLAEAFVMDLYYPPPSASAPPFTVTLRASILSAMPKQQRFLIKGTKGSYLKYGVDPQERQTVEMGRLGRKPEGYGMDQKDEWGQLSVAVEEAEATEWETTRVESVPGDWPALYANLYDAVKSGDASGLAVREEQYIDVIKLIELGLRSSEEGKVLPFN